MTLLSAYTSLLTESTSGSGVGLLPSSVEVYIRALLRDIYIYI